MKAIPKKLKQIRKFTDWSTNFLPGFKKNRKLNKYKNRIPEKPIRLFYVIFIAMLGFSHPFHLYV